MAKGLYLFGAAGLQHPIYGISYANVVDRLTRQNWKIKSLVRQ